MNTRLLPVLLGAALILNLIFSAPTYAFTDIRAGSQLETYVNELSAKGIISGYPDGSFRPTQTINRAEALKIIFETVGISADADSNSGFPDVASSEWFAKYVTKAKRSSIVGGYPDGRFRPGQEVNRAEFVKMALSALPNFSELPLGKDPALQQFTDLDAGQWYVPYLGTAVATNLMPLTEKFRPTAPMARQDAVEIIYRVSKYLEDPFVPTLAEEADFPESELPAVIPIARDQQPFIIEELEWEKPSSSFSSPDEAAMSEEGAFVIDPTDTSSWWKEIPESELKVIYRPGVLEIYSYRNGFNVVADFSTEYRAALKKNVWIDTRARSILSTPDIVEVEKRFRNIDGAYSKDKCETRIDFEKYEQQNLKTAEEFRQFELKKAAEGSIMPELFVWEAPVNRFIPKKNKHGLEYFVYETTLVYSQTPEGPKTTEVLKPVYYFFTDTGAHRIGGGCEELNQLLVENFELRQ